MNRNTKMLLATALISGLATGTAAFAKGHDAKKPGAEKSSCGGKDGCNCKDKDAKGCKAKGKHEEKAKEGKEEAPAAEGTAE